MKKIKSIIEGYLLFVLYRMGLVNDRETLSMVGQRILVCQNCPLNKMGICTACACVIKVKVWSKSEQCPKGKWKNHNKKLILI